MDRHSIGGIIQKLALLWGCLFLFILVGLARRDEAFRHGAFATASLMHHRLARIFSLPVSRPEQGMETRTVRRMVTCSLWGATLWSGFCFWGAWVWRRAGRPSLAIKDSQSSAEAGGAAGKESRFSRRTMLRGTLAGLPALGGGISLFSILIEPSRLKVAQYSIPIRDLPGELEGVRIAHLSDFHLGDYIGLDHVRRSIAMANETQPDFAVMPGDYVQGTALGFEPMARTIAEELKTKHGCVATLGNHDHWHGAEKCRKIFAEHSIPLIDNHRRFLSDAGFSDDPKPGSICVAGVGDFWEDEVDFIRALEGVPDSMPRLVLSHNPDVAELFAGMKPQAKARSGAPSRVDLMLSGHTHGGQVRLPLLGTPVVPSRYGQKYAGGLVNGPDWPVLISRGIGMAVLPVRFRVDPEVVVLTLRRG